VVFRKRWLLVLLSASSLLAACGGGGHGAQPRLPKGDAAQLIALAQAVVRDAPQDPCAAQRDATTLAAKARELVAAGSVPPPLHAQLLAGVDAVAADATACTPPAPAPNPHGQDKPPKEKHHGNQGDNQGNSQGD
jgi:hypothetical protein